MLIFVLSIPPFLIGGMTDLQLLPGLSVSALAGFCPMAAALILVYRDGGTAGARMLLQRSFDFNRIKSKRWFVPVLLLMPAVSLVVYGLMRWLGTPLPATQFQPLPAMLMFIAFFAGGIGEELGWSGYALGPIRDDGYSRGGHSGLGFANVDRACA